MSPAIPLPFNLRLPLFSPTLTPPSFPWKTHLLKNLQKASEIGNTAELSLSRPDFGVLRSREVRKFRCELLQNLSKNRETFGDDLSTVVKICSEFLHQEYGAPKTSLGGTIHKHVGFLSMRRYCREHPRMGSKLC